MIIDRQGHIDDAAKAVALTELIKAQLHSVRKFDGIQQIDQCHPLADWGVMLEDPRAQEEGEAIDSCPKCGGIIHLTKGEKFLFCGTTVCDPCSEKWEKERVEKLMKDWWTKNCPAEFRETDLLHEDFNIEAYNETRKYPLDESLILLGESGSCKTRIACHRAKVALFNGKTVRIMFPDDIKDQPRDLSRREHIASLAKPDLLVLDDLFLAGASKEHTADFVKDLIDKRIREKKATIITSQVDGDSYAKDANKFNNMTGADASRVAAIERRVREKYTAINCEDILNGDGNDQAQF